MLRCYFSRFPTGVSLGVAICLLATTAASAQDKGTKKGAAPKTEEDSDTDKTSEDSGPFRSWEFGVYAKEEYRFRYATVPVVDSPLLDGEVDSVEYLRRGDDHDLHLHFGGTARDYRDRFLIDISLGIFADVDGYVPAGDPSPFGSIYDNPGNIASYYNDSPSWLWLDVYTLFAEYHSDGVLGMVRGGRQVSEHGRDVTFDGAAIDIRAVRPYLDFFAFGGRSIHFFEVDPNLFEDWVASAGAVVRPHPSLKFELDYRFLAEDTANESLLIGGEYGPEEAEADGEAYAGHPNLTEHSYGITGWYRFDEWLYLKAYFRGLDAKPAHAGGAVSTQWDPLELGLDLRGDAQLVTLKESNELDDPFYAVLLESRPHVRLNADLWKAFTTDLGIYTLHGGWAARILTGGEPSPFNRDYGRVYLLFEAADFAVKGPFATLTGEYYYTHSNSAPSGDTAFNVGGSLGYDNDLLRGEVGSYYQRFKYDYYMNVTEVSDVRTYYGELRVRPVKWFSARVRYELEQFDRTIHTVWLTLTQTY